MEMDDLRWILLGVAIVIVVAVYLLSRVRKKDQHSSPLNAANDIPSFSAMDENVDNDWMHGVGPVKVVSESSHDVDSVLNDDALPEPEAIPEEKTYRSKTYQTQAYSERINESDLETDVEPVQESVDEVKPVEKANEVEQKPVKEVDAVIDDVISVYVLAEPDEIIKGEKILSASYALHLDYGDMKIFHRHNQDENKGIQFSMANIQQPGFFEIDHMNEIETTGVSFFMQVNLVDKPSDVLDDMLICAHNLSTMLGATLCDAQRKVLDEACAIGLREKVKRLEAVKVQSV